jgi:hypothetical protein
MGMRGGGLSEGGCVSAAAVCHAIRDVIMLLFRFFVSDFQMSFDIFTPAKYDEAFDVDPVLRLYAIFMLILYVVLASILMANLLIAVLTYKYDPEQIDAESNFQTVMTLEDYQVLGRDMMGPLPSYRMLYMLFSSYVSCTFMCFMVYFLCVVCIILTHLICCILGILC